MVGLQVAQVFHAKRFAELLCSVKPGREDARVELRPLNSRELVFVVCHCNPNILHQKFHMRFGERVQEEVSKLRRCHHGESVNCVVLRTF